MGEMNSQAMDLNSDLGGTAGTTSGTDEESHSDNDHDCLNVFQLVDPVNKALFEKFSHCLKCSGTCVPPIFVCTNNHHICEECAQDTKECWICTTKFEGGKRFFYDDCFENSTFRCKYLREGCQKTLFGKELKDHPRNCDYRPIDCICCEEEDIPYTKFLQHYADLHKDDITSREDGKFRCRYEQNFNLYGAWPIMKAVEFDGHTFFPVARQEGFKNPRIGVFLCIFGSENDARKYNVHISMETEAGNPAAKRPRYWSGWEGPVVSIRVDSREILEDGKCFVTTPGAIKTAYGEQSGWIPTFKIIRVPVLSTSADEDDENQGTRTLMSVKSEPN